jgi:hypothetical protein
MEASQPRDFAASLLLLRSLSAVRCDLVHSAAPAIDLALSMAFARRTPFVQSGWTRKQSETMAQLNRRSFLAASAALAASPALGVAAPASSPFETVIVGAGAAGIAAARKLAAAGRRYVLIEATDHVGGRCVTDTRSFGVPFDRGAHWVYLPDANPLTRLTLRRGIDVYPAPQSQKVRIGLRYAREGELEDFLTAQVRTIRAINDAARKADIPSEQVVPNDLADWHGTVEFVLGPYNCAKDLAQVSSFDFAKAAERNAAAFCTQGFGTLLLGLAQGLNIQLATPARSIDTRGNVAVDTARGTINATTAIVTVPTNVVASGGLRFLPDLGHHQIDAFGRMSLGSYDHIALELNGNPLGLESDDLVFEKSNDTHTADPRQCVRHVAVHHRRGRRVRPRSFGARRSGDDRFRRQLACQSLWLRDQAGDRAQTRHALECRSLHARRLVGRGAGQPVRAPSVPRSDRRQCLVCRRSGARNALGHGGRRLGIRRARRRRGAAPARPGENLRPGRG